MKDFSLIAVGVQQGALRELFGGGGGQLNVL